MNRRLKIATRILMGKVPPQGLRMVLVTVGTTKFDLLIKTVDEESFQKELQRLGYTHVVYQVGTGRYVPKTSILQISVDSYLDNFCKYVQLADLVISHLGAGNLLEVFKHQKMAVFVPNPSVKGDHQSELSEVLDKSLVSSLTRLKSRIRNPGRGTGEFYDKLLPSREFNNILYKLVDL